MVVTYFFLLYFHFRFLTQRKQNWRFSFPMVGHYDNKFSFLFPFFCLPPLKFLIFYVFYKAESCLLHFVLYHFKFFYQQLSYGFLLLSFWFSFSIYGCIQNWTRVTKIKNESKKHGLNKTPSCSQVPKGFPFPLKFFFLARLAFFVSLWF